MSSPIYDAPARSGVGGFFSTVVNFFPYDLRYKHTYNLKTTDLDWGYPVGQQVATRNDKDFSQLK